MLFVETNRLNQISFHLEWGNFSHHHGLQTRFPDLELELLAEDQLHRLFPRPAVVQDRVAVAIVVQQLGHEVKFDSGSVRQDRPIITSNPEIDNTYLYFNFDLFVLHKYEWGSVSIDINFWGCLIFMFATCDSSIKDACFTSVISCEFATFLLWIHFDFTTRVRQDRD